MPRRLAIRFKFARSVFNARAAADQLPWYCFNALLMSWRWKSSVADFIPSSSAGKPTLGASADTNVWWSALKVLFAVKVWVSGPI